MIEFSIATKHIHQFSYYCHLCSISNNILIHFCVMQHFDQTFYIHNYNLILQSFNFSSDSNRMLLMLSSFVALNFSLRFSDILCLLKGLKLLNMAQTNTFKGIICDIKCIQYFQSDNNQKHYEAYFQSRKQLYNHKCPSVCLSVSLSAKPLNSLKSSSFIILHSSFIILHHPSSSFIIHPSTFFIHPSSNIHHPSFILH